MKRQIGLVLIAVGLSPARLVAADLPPTAEPPAPFFQTGWAGFYLGADLGTPVDGRDRRVRPGAGGLVIGPAVGGQGGAIGAATGRIEAPNLFGGGFGGYNWQRGAAVFGLEGDLQSLGPIDDLLGTARFRFGYGGERVMVYGTAGLALLSQPKTVLGAFVGGNGGAGGDGGPGGAGGAGGAGFGSLGVVQPSARQVGFAGGVGAEYRVSRTVGAGLEALYLVFDDKGHALGIPSDVLTVRGRLTVYLDQPGGSGASAAPAQRAGDPWAGLYAGGHIGALYDLSGGIGAASLADGSPGTAGTRGIDGGGGGGGAVAFAALDRNASVVGGGHLGYGWRAANLVYGPEGDLDLSADDRHRVGGTLRGRLGWATPSYMAYGTAGLALDHASGIRAVLAGDGGAGGGGGTVLAGPGGAGGTGGRASALRTSGTDVGFVVGGGLEARISDRVSAGVEGLYYGLGDKAVPVPAGAGRSFAAGDGDDAFVLRTRVSFSLQP